MSSTPHIILTPKFAQAFKFALTLHAGHPRKGSGTPYMAHLMSVAALVLEHGGNETQAIAALLHDAVEDQGGVQTLATIRTWFGEAVADIVDGCSDTYQLPKPEWQPRKEAYLAHLETAPPEILLVSLADKVHNARSILSDYQTLGDALWERFTGKKAGTIWYYQTLVEIFTRRCPGPLARELNQVVGQFPV